MNHICYLHICYLQANIIDFGINTLMLFQRCLMFRSELFFILIQPRTIMFFWKSMLFTIFGLTHIAISSNKYLTFTPWKRTHSLIEQVCIYNTIENYQFIR